MARVWVSLIPWLRVLPEFVCQTWIVAPAHSVLSPCRNKLCVCLKSPRVKTNLLECPFSFAYCKSLYSVLRKDSHCSSLLEIFSNQTFLLAGWLISGDLKPADEVAITGPVGKEMLMPTDPNANIIMVMAVLIHSLEFLSNHRLWSFFVGLCSSVGLENNSGHVKLLGFLTIFRADI